MTRQWPCVLIALLCFPLTSGSSAHAECAGVLWVEAPVGSDRWSVASAPKTRFASKEDFQRQADDLSTLHFGHGQVKRVAVLLLGAIDARTSKGK